MAHRIWLVVLSLLGVPAIAGVPNRTCERFVTERDILIDVRGTNLVFAITNTSDRCTLIFSDLLGTKVGDEQVRPVFTAIRMEALDGTLLSGTDAMGEWYTSYLPFYAPFVDDQSYTFKFERLAAGAVRVKRWTIGQMLEFLEWQRLREKRSALPWGTTVVMQIKVTVHIDERAAAGIVDETPLKKVDAVSAKFLVLLPTLPAEGDVAR